MRTSDVFHCGIAIVFLSPAVNDDDAKRSYDHLYCIKCKTHTHTHSDTHSHAQQSKINLWEMTDRYFVLSVCVCVKYSHFVPFAAHLNMCSISYENGNKMLWMHLYIHYPLCYSYACMYVGADVSQTYVWNYIRMVMYTQTRPTPSNNKHKSHIHMYLIPFPTMHIWGYSILPCFCWNEMQQTTKKNIDENA